MAFELGTLVNLILCISIVIVGYLAYLKKSDIVLAYLALAYVLFGISHIIALFGIEEQTSIPMVVIRILGYSMVLFAVYTASKKK